MKQNKYQESISNLKVLKEQIFNTFQPPNIHRVYVLYLIAETQRKQKVYDSCIRYCLLGFQEIENNYSKEISNNEPNIIKYQIFLLRIFIFTKMENSQYQEIMPKLLDLKKIV